ncbi:hypothetical protein [Streptomyces sp. NBC_01314]|uniref:hypothetical protein n=1 Tax=Streptomyces sp. NBC_01314 TaxID=2903821 RepID=UPI00308F9D86|nr:hypothetical protein OG622_01775 [Streptomyces sp. NBC_01314]
MNNLTLIPDTPQGDAPQTSPGWRFSVIPPKDVRACWYTNIKAIRRPAGTLAVPAIAATATLHFTHVLHDSDTVMALGLTALTVGYDAVIAVCRTWHKTSPAGQPSIRQDSHGRRTAA